MAAPLIYAAKADDPDFARFLLKHGADKNTRDYDGSTVLFVARAMKHDAVAKILEKAGSVASGPTVRK